MISDIQAKYDQLSSAQKDIFAGYGLRQVKHFVEISLANIEPVLPENAFVQGVNAAGKVQALMQRLGNTIYGFPIYSGKRLHSPQIALI